MFASWLLLFYPYFHHYPKKRVELDLSPNDNNFCFLSNVHNICFIDSILFWFWNVFQFTVSFICTLSMIFDLLCMMYIVFFLLFYLFRFSSYAQEKTSCLVKHVIEVFEVAYSTIKNFTVILLDALSIDFSRVGLFFSELQVIVCAFCYWVT